MHISVVFTIAHFLHKSSRFGNELPNMETHQLAKLSRRLAKAPAQQCLAFVAQCNRSREPHQFGLKLFLYHDDLQGRMSDAIPCGYCDE